MYSGNVQDCTREYVNLGFAIFPCNGKVPATAHGVKDATTNVDQIAKWFANGNKNIGIACGVPSKVLLLDADDIAALKKLENQYGPLPKTWTVRTGGGEERYQFYFQYDERCTLLKNAVKFAGGLDIRTTGGYVIAPPSIHPVTQKRYEWIVSPDDCELASAPDWLLALIPKHGEAVPAKSSTLTIQRAKTLEERVGLFLASAPVAVSGEDGHGTTFGVCCSLVENFGTLDDESLFAALMEWNDRCSPPWNESDLRRKLTEARKKKGVIDLPTETDVDSLPTLDAEAYHGLAGDILRTLEPSTEAAPAALLLTFLTAFSVAVGRSPHFIVEGGKTHPNLYSAIVGRSSRSRKGTSLGRIQDLFELVNVPKVSGLSSGEGLISALRDDEMQKQDGKFVMVGGVSDKRLWTIEPEFARTLKTMKRDGNSLSAIIRQAWDSGDIASLTKGNPLRASGVHLGITTHITSDELKQTMADVDAVNGFANRFLWSFVTRSKKLPHGGEDLDTSSLRQRVSDAVEKAKTIGRMTRSDDARKLWEAVYDSLTDEKESPVWDSVTSRPEGQVLRLSMLFALLDCTPVIEVVHLRSALAVWSFCDDSARLLFSDVKTKSESFESKIVGHVRNQPGITRTELRKRFHHSTKMTDLFNRTLTDLISRSVIVCVPCLETRQVDRLYLGTKPVPLVPLAGSITEPEGLTSLTSQASRGENEAERGPESLTSQTSRSQTAKPMDLAEFFDWRNKNGVTFTKREDGVFWVTPTFASLLTPEIEATITANQSIVSMFVAPEKEPTTIARSGTPYWLPEGELLDEETFMKELTEM